MAKKKKFMIQFKVNVLTDFEITADSMEAALQEAKTYGVTDVVEIKGGHIDSELEVTGVYY